MSEENSEETLDEKLKRLALERDAARRGLADAEQMVWEEFGGEGPFRRDRIDEIAFISSTLTEGVVYVYIPFDLELSKTDGFCERFENAVYDALEKVGRGRPPEYTVKFEYITQQMLDEKYKGSFKNYMS